ncbi:hypothetical protein CS0771_49710 [Catellatospora sp. IY07-71]|uniref:FG-GAP repeat domain-containing protein n=1 Tax=Catellatospora sp. IY07-71 TaxID=2728827 RepID=UPI001BB372F0|nr:VCBS repeat-containing protein [Catellatospora sp. IY07-71]BCJ75427.1 hypothetical protein CS0771_49710 [Catellatospora sp. IY07-71]
MSQWDPYNVWLMRVKLTGGGMFGGSPTDFTGDGHADVVTFTQDHNGDAYVAPSTGTAFAGGGKWHDWFAPFNETPLTGDFTGDGRDDLVVFTHDGEGDVFVALSTGSSFANPVKWHEFFAPWGEFPALGDVNGDGRDGLITFTLGGTNDVYVALSTGSAFAGTTVKWNDFFCLAGEFPYLGDVNRDNRDDIIVFSQNPSNDVYVGLSTGSGFRSGAKWHDFFGLTGERTY